MQRSFGLLLSVAFAVATSGCSGEYQVAPVPPAAETPESTASPAAATAAPDQQPQGTETPVAPPAAPTSAPAPSPAAGFPIKLSAGVALAQSLPTGTAMGFSVDYRFTQGSAQGASRYVWVIQGNQLEPVRLDVELQQQGTLQTFVTQWRPEAGPFRCHIEDGGGQRLSDSVPLR
jgi:hypothetical protein